MINHKINECIKLAQKEEEVIHWELGKNWKLDHTTKWYVHKPVSDT